MICFDKISTQLFEREVDNFDDIQKKVQSLGVHFRNDLTYCLFWHPDLASAKKVFLTFYRFSADFNLVNETQISCHAKCLRKETTNNFVSFFHKLAFKGAFFIVIKPQQLLISLVGY